MLRQSSTPERHLKRQPLNGVFTYAGHAPQALADRPVLQTALPACDRFYRPFTGSNFVLACNYWRILEIESSETETASIVELIVNYAGKPRSPQRTLCGRGVVRWRSSGEPETLLRRGGPNPTLSPGAGRQPWGFRSSP